MKGNMGKVKSRAQYQKFQELHQQGKMSAEKLEEATSGVDIRSLPDRAEPKAKLKYHGKVAPPDASSKGSNSYRSHKKW
jgi:hypothetical protein